MALDTELVLYRKYEWTEKREFRFLVRARASSLEDFLGGMASGTRRLSASWHRTSGYAAYAFDKGHPYMLTPRGWREPRPSIFKGHPQGTGRAKGRRALPAV
jgi:hypothetical protein